MHTMLVNVTISGQIELLHLPGTWMIPPKQYGDMLRFSSVVVVVASVKLE